jgi:hypothetical protein
VVARGGGGGGVEREEPRAHSGKGGTETMGRVMPSCCMTHQYSDRVHGQEDWVGDAFRVWMQFTV